MNTHVTKSVQGKIGLGVGVFALLTAVNSLHATTYNWNVVSGFWDTPGNWSPSGTPGAADNLDLNYTAQNSLTLNGTSQSVNELKKTQAFRIDFFGNNTLPSTLTAVNIVNANGSLIFQNGGSLTVAGGLTVNATNLNIGGGATFFGATTASTVANMLTTVNISGVTTMTAGTLLVNTSGSSYSLGRIELTGGTISLNNTSGTKSVSPIANVSGLNGVGGIIQGAVNAGSASTNVVSLAINNASNYSTAAVIRDSAAGVAGANGVLNLSKTGAGVQALTGANTYTGSTSINGGALLVNGSHAGGGAYSVGAAGTLGGTGTISASSVTFADGGRLDVGGTGVEDISLGLTGSLDLSAVNTAGSLLFDLASTASSDKLFLTAGTLNVGTLNFNEFTFTTLSGFGVGAYTLMDSSTSIVGTIGSASGSIGEFIGTLSIDGLTNDVVLTVAAVPEPSTYAVMAGGLCMAFAALRRRAKR